MNEALLRTNAQREVTIIRKPGDEVVEEICNLNWSGLSKNDLINVAWIYYYFSVQFRENLEIACRLLPDDKQLQELDKGERDAVIEFLTACKSSWKSGAERLDGMIASVRNRQTF